MTDRPIIMSGPMVRAIRDGRKTQTRRVLNPQPEWMPKDGMCAAGWSWGPLMSWPDAGGFAQAMRKHVRHQPGDRLWVKETWHPPFSSDDDSNGVAVYLATVSGPEPYSWRSPLFMPRRLSRLTLHITDVRVQRVQEITPPDVSREGVERDPETGGYWVAIGKGVFGHTRRYVYAADAFRDLWDSLNAKRGHGWDRNPWVAAITFRPEWANIDEARP